MSCTVNGVDHAVNGVGRYCLNGFLGLGCKLNLLGNVDANVISHAYKDTGTVSLR